jgi:hypothetical protein
MDAAGVIVARCSKVTTSNGMPIYTARERKYHTGVQRTGKKFRRPRHPPPFAQSPIRQPTNSMYVTIHGVRRPVVIEILHHR